MYCGRCGARVEEEQKFCTACGSPVTAATVAQQGRIEKHLKLLAILWLVISVMRLIPGIGLLFLGRLGFPFIPPHVRPLVLPLAAIGGVFLIATAVVGIIVGWGLLERASWARILAIILGIIALIHVPFGTALGIYTLWVLLPAQSEEEYRRLSRAV